MFGELMTLHFNLQQNSNEDKIDVDITRCIFQQYKTSICVRGIYINTLFFLLYLIDVHEEPCFDFWLLLLLF